MDEMRQFVIDKYDEAEKTAHVDYDKVIILSIKLKNGYVIVEHSICRDPEQFDIEKGFNLCKEKVISHLLKIYEPVESKNDRR